LRGKTKRIRICTVCGAKVELPKTKEENEGKTEIGCHECGAKAPLQIKRRNGRVTGLKGCFFSGISGISSLMKKR